MHFWLACGEPLGFDSATRAGGVTTAVLAQYLTAHYTLQLYTVRSFVTRTRQGTMLSEGSANWL